MNVEPPKLDGAGSTFISPMMKAWAKEFKQAKAVEVNYQTIGSLPGIHRMIEKQADFAATDLPMIDLQLQQAQKKGGDVVHIPLCLGAVVPVYNLADVREPLIFSGPVLADIFIGKVTKWNDKAIQDLNPGVKLPNQDITPVHRSDGSATTAIFVDYLAKVSSEWKEKVGVGTSVKWPVGIGTKASQGLMGTLKGSLGTIGYAEFVYVQQNKIDFGLVKNKEGVAIKASLKSITAAAQNSLKDIPEDLRYSITNASGKDSYPICGTSWAVVYVDQPAGKGQQLVNFLRWIIHDGQRSCEGLHYATLPQGLVEQAEKKLGKVKR
jgi:phosphate transport system substrate-binding protein